MPNTAPFILSEDREFIDAYNSRYYGTEFEVLLNEIPSPYIGDPKASVILLNLNPGYSLEDSNSPALEHFREVAKAIPFEFKVKPSS